MPLSILDQGDSIHLVDEAGNILQTTPKSSLPPAKLQAMQEYPPVEQSRIIDPRVAVTQPGAIAPQVPPDFSIGRTLGQGIHQGAVDLGRSLGSAGRAIAQSGPVGGLVRESGQFFQGLGGGVPPPAQPQVLDPNQRFLQQMQVQQQPGALPVQQGMAPMEIPNQGQAPQPGGINSNQNLYDTGVAMELGGLGKQYEAGRQLGGKIVGALDETERIAKERADKFDALAQQTQAEFDYMRKRRDDRIAQLESEAPAKSFSDWFAEKSTPGKILWGIALGAATAASLTKAGSSPLNFIDGVIRQDLAAQAARFQKRQQLVDIENTALGQFMKNHENLRLALGEAAEASYKVAAAKTEAAKQRVANAQQRGNLDLLSGQLLQKAAMQRQQNDLLSAQIAKVKAESTGMDAERMIQGLGYVPFGTKDEVKELRTTFTTASKANQSIDRLISLTGKTGKSMSPEDRAKAFADSQALVGILRSPFLGPGVMDKNERARLEKVVSNPTNFFSLDMQTRASLERVKQILSEELSIKASSQGVRGYSGSSEKPPGALQQLR